MKTRWSTPPKLLVATAIWAAACSPESLDTGDTGGSRSMQMDLEPRCNFQELAGRWEGEPPSPPSITAWQVLVLDERARDGGVIGYTELWDDGELVCTLDIECIAGEPGHAATRKQDAYAPCREGYYRLMVEHHTLWVDFNGVNEPSGDPYALGCESAHLDH